MKIGIESTTHFRDEKLIIPIEYIVIDGDRVCINKDGNLEIKPVIEFEKSVGDVNNDSLTAEIFKEQYNNAVGCLNLDWLSKTITIDLGKIKSAGLSVKIHSMKSYEERQRQKK